MPMMFRNHLFTMRSSFAPSALWDHSIVLAFSAAMMWAILRDRHPLSWFMWNEGGLPAVAGMFIICLTVIMGINIVCDRVRSSCTQYGRNIGMGFICCGLESPRSSRRCDSSPGSR